VVQGSTVIPVNTFLRLSSFVLVAARTLASDINIAAANLTSMCVATITAGNGGWGGMDPLSIALLGFWIARP
jgi:hypothetical protein